MNFNGFDLNLLVALDALLNERSVTRAAERLHITQPAMSNALQRLRLRFDDQILERSGRELRLTPVAEALVPAVQDLLQRAERLLGASDGFHPASATRTFRIAMSDYCATILLPIVVETLFKEAPNVHCDAEPLSERSVERLCARRLDFCISAQDLHLINVFADDAKVRRAELFRDRFVSATSLDHPAVEHGLSKDTFLKCGHISYRSGDGTRSLEDQAKGALGLNVTVHVVTPTISAMPLVLKGTDFIATFPARLVKSLKQASMFQVFQCPFEFPDLVETLFWHPQAEADRGHQWMKELFIRAAAQLGDPAAVS